MIDDWPASVERRLRELDDGAVIDGWLRLVERDAAPRAPALVSLVSHALARCGDVAPFIARIDAQLRRAARAVRDALVEAAAHASVALRPELIELLHGILRDPEARRDVAENAVAIAGACARCAPRAAALIAERARWDRGRRLGEAQANTPIEQSTVASTAALAAAVRTSGCAALAATALIELERGTDRDAWATALLAVAPEAGAQYLARMRGRPGWSALAGEVAAVPDDPLDGLTSPLADVRRAALEALARAPRGEHLQAFLLGAELDRFVTRHIYATPWQRLTPIPWLPLLIAQASAPKPVDAVLAAAPPGPPPSLLHEQLAVLRADQLLDQLLDSGAARAAMAVPQALTHALRALAEQGVEAFARAIAVPPLSDDDRAALEAEEAELAAQAGSRG